ncbi:MAG: CDP-glucose 4,6-dehydratase [Burkholderiaceae bacterium]
MLKSNHSNPTRQLPQPQSAFWQGKRVLLTGHTGFKGAWLAQWLSAMGAHVTGVALEPCTEPNLFNLAKVGDSVQSHHIADIRDAQKVASIVQQTKPEIVLHLAAQALVRDSYTDPLGTFASNVMGTANVLDALRHVDSVRCVVAVTTDKVYANQEWVWPYRETDRLGGHDPYSASKAGSEIVISAYRSSFLAAKKIALASARAGNVIGGGDWSANRIIPDAVRAWQANQALSVRRPQAIRPWQHVIEPIGAYLILAERLWNDDQFAQAWNFGPQTHEAATVRDVVGLAQQAFGSGKVEWGDGTDGPHEAGLLMLDTSLAKSQLGIQSVFPLSQAIEMTMHWYRDLNAGMDAAQLCQRDIAQYLSNVQQHNTNLAA